MQVIEVNDSSTVKRFLRLPFSIYINDPYWIPHLKQDVEKVFDSDKNKLFKEGGKAKRWILSDGQKDLGRIAAFVNPSTVNSAGQPTGGIGFYECTDDYTASSLLFDTAINWLKQQKIEAVDGPVNFGDRSQFWGLQVDNFNNPPVYPMNYNPPYYQKHFEQYGFKIFFEQYVYWRSLAVPTQAVFHRKYNQIKNDPKFKISNIKGRRLKDVANDFRIVYNEAWSAHDQFNPLSEKAAQKIFNTIKAAIDPEIIFFVHYENKPIAFYVNLPELNQIFKYVNGNLNWWGKLKFLWHKFRNKPNRMTGLVFGVVKEWQGKGIEAGIIVHAEESIRCRGKYNDTVLSWIGDFNPKMIKVAENLGATKWRTLYTYRYLFDRNKEFKRALIMS